MTFVYATLDNRRIRIGYQDHLYLLRVSQAAAVEPAEPGTDLTAESWLYRFPWADEDDVPPGEFRDPHRRYPIVLAGGHPAGQDICRPETVSYLKYERVRNGIRRPVLSCEACGRYWTPVREGLTANVIGALHRAALDADLDTGFVLRAAAAHIGTVTAARQAALWEPR